ncbi:MAG: FMN-binding negative transcriptional regulator [Chitinophagaceae bacterium]|nr:FMN-binding negative transcriptional regulator [Chitinophagaceae bacterium]
MQKRFNAFSDFLPIAIGISIFNFQFVMYNLPYFKIDNPEEVLQFMKDHPFIMLTGVDVNNHPIATQVPVFMDEKDGKIFLSGHMMRNADHQKAFAQNPNVLALFTGPHAYVSATWYTNSQMGSTWNYMTVHAKGTIRFQDGDAIPAALERLSLHYEKGNADSSTVYHNLPAEYTERMLKGILAFEIEITAIEHVFKLSQNRDQQSFENIISRLKEQGVDAGLIAAEMEKIKSKLFSS